MMYQKKEIPFCPLSLYKCIVVLLAAAAFILTACSGLQEDGGEKNIRINLPPIVSASGNSRALSGDRLPTLKEETRRYRVTVNGMTREGTGSSYEFTLAVGIRATAIIECLNSSGEVIIRAVKDFTVAGGDNIIDINLKNDGNEIIPSAPQPVPNQVTYSYGEATLGNPSGLPSDPATYNEGDLFTVADGANMTWQHGLNGGGFTEWITNVALEGDDASSTADVQAGNAVIVNGKYKMPAGGVTLTAQWQKNTYTITYNNNAPSYGGQIATVTWQGNDPTTTPQPSVDALSTTTAFSGTVTVTGISGKTYTFAGWNTQPDGNGTRYSAGQTITMTDDITLYAQWSEKNLYTIMFADDPNGPTSDALPNTISNVEQGQTSTSWTNPTATGYRFNGWKITDTATSDVINANAGAITSYAPSQNVTLTAVWTVQTYTINYNANGGQITQRNTESFTIRDNITFSVATRAGYEFANWRYTNETGLEAVDNPTELIARASGTTVSLTAQWQELDTLYVDADSGNDTSGDGTDGNPFATLKKAFDVARALSGEKTIELQTDITLTGNITNNGSGVTYTIKSADAGNKKTIRSTSSYRIQGSTHPIILENLHIVSERNGGAVISQILNGIQLKNTTIETDSGADYSAGFSTSASIVMEGSSTVDKIKLFSTSYIQITGTLSVNPAATLVIDSSSSSNPINGTTVLKGDVDANYTKFKVTDENGNLWGTIDYQGILHKN